MAAIKTENMSSNNLTIVVVLITLLVVGISGFVGKMLVTTIVRDTKVAQKKSAAEKQLQTNIVAAPKLVDAYNQLGDKSGVLADALPNDVDFPSLLVTLENMTNHAGLVLKSVTPGLVAADDGSGDTTAAASTASAASPTPQTYKFQLAFTGTYAGMKLFLQEIETSARPMRVLDMQLAGGGNALTGQFDIQTFYQAKATLPFGEETVK